MQLETFRGRDLRALIRHVSHFLGDDAMVVRTHVLRRPAGDVFEVVAARAAEVEAFRNRLDAGRAPEPDRARLPRPYVVALVGPPGAGKTTGAVKLALNERGLGTRRVGFLSLDTYRVGAIEQLQTYAEIAGLPLEVVYHPREVPHALKRLEDRDVVVVDTPGRWADDADWVEALAALRPDEVHLTIPAGVRLDVARALKARMAAAGPTHLLLTKLDEVPREAGLADLADALRLPARWVCDGPDVPDALAPAGPRILETLGLSPESHAQAG